MCRTICALRNLWAWYPPVGVFIAVLAVVSVAVPFFRDLGKIGKGEKALWTLIMLGLMLLEIKSIYQERNFHDKEQAEARAEQLKQFRGIANSIDKSLAEMKHIADLSGGSLELSGKALKEITGGGQYCWLIAWPWKEQVQLSVANSGRLPLERCSVRIFKKVTPAPTPRSFDDALELSNPLLVRELGPVAPGKSQIPNMGPKLGKGQMFKMTTTDIILPSGSYEIEITTRNDSFSETLTILPDSATGQHNKDGFERIEIRDEKHKVLFLANLEVRDEKGRVLYEPESH